MTPFGHDILKLASTYRARGLIDPVTSTRLNKSVNKSTLRQPSVFSAPWHINPCPVRIPCAGDMHYPGLIIHIHDPTLVSHLMIVPLAGT